jgi:hypothetical protein
MLPQNKGGMMESPKVWHPCVLSEYEVGRVFSAIAEVKRRGKPLAEVGMRICEKEDLLRDLSQCLAQDQGTGKAFIWTMPSDKGFRYGFFSHEWVFRALIFMEQRDLDPKDRIWIQGLVFGYTPSAIQEFLDRQAKQ